MLSRNVRYYALLLVSALSLGIAVSWIDRAVERREWLGQDALLGLVLILFALALMIWGGTWLRLEPADKKSPLLRD